MSRSVGLEARTETGGRTDWTVRITLTANAVGNYFIIFLLTSDCYSSLLISTMMYYGKPSLLSNWRYRLGIHIVRGLARTKRTELDSIFCELNIIRKHLSNVYKRYYFFSTFLHPSFHICSQAYVLYLVKASGVVWRLIGGVGGDIPVIVCTDAEDDDYIEHSLRNQKRRVFLQLLR